MGLLSIFQRRKQTAAKAGKSRRPGKAPARQAPLSSPPNPADLAEAVREARARARRRLMGATVLLLAGVVGFTLLFDSQPRPTVPVDLPIEIPNRNGPGLEAGVPLHVATAASGQPESVSYDHVAPASAAAVPSPGASPARPTGFAALAAALGGSQASPASSPLPAPVAAVPPPAAASPASHADARAYISPALRPGHHGASSSDPKPPVINLTPPHPAAAVASHVAAAAHAAASRPSPAVAHAAASHPSPAAARTAEARPSPAVTESGAVAAALLSGESAPKPTPATATGDRFVVQVGAFAEDSKVRETRARVEKLGLKTYTQAVQTPAGKRVRVRLGPFTSKAEADRAAARLKGSGLPAAVLAL